MRKITVGQKACYPLIFIFSKLKFATDDQDKQFMPQINVLCYLKKISSFTIMPQISIKSLIKIIHQRGGKNWSEIYTREQIICFLEELIND